jgi:heat shock protein HslJ
MKTSTAIGIVVALVVGVGGWYWLGQGIAVPLPLAIDYKDATYIIGGQPVTLVDGRAEAAAAPGSATKVVTQYFGNEAVGDLNGDGTPDVAFLLTQDGGGSGTFYYVVAAIKTASGYEGTSAVLLGDRVAPQTTEIRSGELIVNYAVRPAGSPMTAQPSEGKSLYLKLDTATMQFGEVVQNFEGEADPSRMTLDMQTWTWVKTSYNNDTVVTPAKVTAFTLTFKKDGTFSATTDCNGVGGSYEVKGKSITFSKMMSTLMYCDGSQEGDFRKMLEASESYLFTSKGELVFNLKLDSGSFIFR